MFNFFIKKKVIVRGIQRSGTNFLEDLLSRLNLNVINKGNIKRNSPKHKHFRLQDDKSTIIMERQYYNEIFVNSIEDLNIRSFGNKNLKNILIYKDPVNWILSINRWAKKCNWIPQNKDLIYDKRLLKEYLFEWDNFHLTWFKMLKSTDKILPLQWENLLSNFDESLHQIFKFNELEHNLELKISDFNNINLSEKSEVLEKEHIDPELATQIYNIIKFKNFRKIYL